MSHRLAILVGTMTLAISIASQALGNELWELPHAWQALPHGYVQTGEAPGRGRLWSNSDATKFAPTYCVYRTRVVCVIYHLTKSDLAEGKSWPAIPEGAGVAPIDHVGLTSEATGLAVGLYFLTEAQLETIQPPYDYHY